MRSPSMLPALVGLSAWALVACDSEPPVVPPPPPPPGTFALIGPAAPVEVVPEAFETFSVALERGEGVPGAVRVEVVSAPDGVSGGPAVIVAADSSEADVSLDVGALAPAALGEAASATVRATAVDDPEVFVEIEVELALRDWPGRVDSTFAAASEDFGLVGGVKARAMRVDADDRIHLVVEAGGELALVRLAPDGTPDPALPTPVPVAGDTPVLKGFQLVADGGAVLAYTNASGSHVKRVDDAGALVGAEVTAPAGDTVFDALVGPDGRLFACGGRDDQVTGYVGEGDGSSFVSTYAAPINTDWTVRDCRLRALPVGGFVVAYEHGAIAERDLALYRLDADGHVDLDFDMPVYFVDGDENLVDLAVDGTNAQIVMLARHDYNGARVLERVLGFDMTPVETFAGGGERTSGSDYLALAVRPSTGAIFTAATDPAALFQLWARDADGAPAGSFGSGSGVARIRDTDSPMAVVALGVQSDGRVVAVGTEGAGADALVRLERVWGETTATVVLVKTLDSKETLR